MCHHRGYEHLREYEAMRGRESDEDAEIEIRNVRNEPEEGGDRDGKREPVVPPADD